MGVMDRETKEISFQDLAQRKIKEIDPVHNC